MYQADVSYHRPFLSLSDLDPEDVSWLGDIAVRYGTSPRDFKGALAGARVALIFTGPSTRTRSSFWSAARTLGCDVLTCGPSDLQVTTGEEWRDTAACLAHYLDAAVVRTNGPQQDLVEFSKYLPATINALTYVEHPTQAIADLCALRERFGRVDGLRVAYLGQVNNTARALALLVCKTAGMALDVYSPEGFGFADAEVEVLNRGAGRDAVRQHDRLPAAPAPADAVYTTRWRSMGAAPDEPDWLARLTPFAVTADTMRAFSGRSEAIFMHDLPAVRDEEVAPEVLDGPASLAPRQAYHKGSAAAAALLWALGAAVGAGEWGSVRMAA